MEPGSSPSRCPECNGTGRVRRSYAGAFGHFINVTTCKRCGGSGFVITQPCRVCGGSGKERKRKRLIVKIPPGVDEETIIKLSGEGEAGLYGGPPGDLYISLRIKPHELFEREGDDIVYVLPLNFAQAALGCEVRIPTLDGDYTLKIPPGVQTGDVLRIKGRGVPKKGGRGDFLVKIFVSTPRNLTPEQRRLLEELSKTLGPGSLPEGGKSFFDKVKGFFKG